MSFDLQINLQTGDLVWNSIRDLAGAEAENLIQQRIHVRLTVERGSFIYDRSGTLGNRLSAMLGTGVPRDSNSLAMLIREALAPMTDITITDIIVYQYNDGSGVVTDPRKISAKISYQTISLAAVDNVSALPEQTSIFSIPV